MPVAYKRKEYRTATKLWDVIRDCVAGEIAVKAKGPVYLPAPNPTDTSPENAARYIAYVVRAVFYNVVKRTLGGLVGQVFAREPIIEVPDLLRPVINDATGMGVDSVQLAKETCRFVLAYGRAGLWTDYPQQDGAASRADLERGDIRPTITSYNPFQIINWRTVKRGGRSILSLVVIEEDIVAEDDGFEEKMVKQWRVLRLISDQYTIEIYTDRNGTVPLQRFTPKDSSGNPITEIPFVFVGCENNDPDIDEPPLYDLSALNIAHYRNSADYEESSFIVGQPTPYFAGLTEAWVKDVFKNQVQLGSRAAVPLPVGGTAGMLQPDANTMPKEAMEQKERQMIALGAKLVTAPQVQRTATEANIEFTDETSTLSSTADNVSAAMTYMLKWCAVFTGQLSQDQIQAETEAIKFNLNTEFDLVKLAAEDRQRLIEEWQFGAISWPELRENLRRGGIVHRDDATAKADIEKEQEAIAKRKAAEAAASRSNGGGSNNAGAQA